MLIPLVTETNIDLPVGIDFGTTYTVVAFILDGRMHFLTIDGQWLLNSSQLYKNTNWKTKLRNNDLSNTTLEGCTYVFRMLKTEMQRQYYNAQKAVISVPVCFSTKTRELLKQAMILAGWSVIRIITEPVAVVIASQNLKNGIYGICDVGGGTFDFALVQVQDGCVHTLDTIGSTQIGGIHYDQLLKTYYPGHTIQEIEILRINNDLEVSNIMQTEYHKIQQLIEICLQKHPAYQPTQIIFAGGLAASTYKALCTTLKYPAQLHAYPQTCVAEGAALHAMHQLNNSKENMLIESTPLAIGLETLTGQIDWLIDRGTPIPYEHTEIFKNIVPGQTSMQLNIFQGYPGADDTIHLIYSYKVPLNKDIRECKITFMLDLDGVMHIEVRSYKTNNLVNITRLKNLWKLKCDR